MLDHAERLDWLQLIRTQSIGPITFHRLMAKFGRAAEALNALPELSRRAGRGSSIKVANRANCEAELKEAEKRGARLVASCEDNYPRTLKAIPDHPPLIYVRGKTSLFEKPSIAIIGARNASGVGRKIARMLARDLGEAGYVVTSGLARGIDGAAHEAAIDTGTVAVVAGGVDIVYPPEHDKLTARIARDGAVISECAMGAQPTARDFPKRNRLISGLSRGVVVVEAAAKSGTLITANFALEQGREVFAVPGSPLDPRCRGANRLIRDGATLVERAEDIIEALNAQMRGFSEGNKDLFDWAEDAPEQRPDQEAFEALKRTLLEIMSFTPLHRDEILREADAPPGIVADALLELVLTGELTEHSGGRFSLSANEPS